MTRPRILVIATGHALSLALLAGNRVLAQSHDDIGRGHAEALMPAVQALLAPFGGAGAPLDEIVVETGPGSFTGLRIGLAAAKALGLAKSVPVYGVRSTRLVAAEARAHGVSGPQLVVLAAPRGQIWSERFDADDISTGPPVVLMPDAVRTMREEGLAVTGSGVAMIGLEAAATNLPHAAAPFTDPPHAAAFRWLVSQPREPASPLYVRQEPG